MDEWVCVLDPCHHGGVLVGYIGIGVLCIGVVGCLMSVPSGVIVHMCGVHGLG